MASALVDCQRPTKYGQEYGQAMGRRTDMGRPIHKLTDIGVKGKKDPGMYADGGNLYLRVAPGGSKGWIFRFALNGKTRDAGLGSYPAITLAKGREEAERCRQLVAGGVDPLAARNEERQAEQLKAARAKTFEECADEFFKARAAGWRNPKTEPLLRAALKTHAYPIIGKLSVALVDTELVMQVLQPLWALKPAAANSLRQTLEAVLAAAKIRGYRTGENPAIWRGHLDQLLPKRSKVRPIQHHAALPYADVPAFMHELRTRDDAVPNNSPVRAGVSLRASALELLILTATRTCEVMGARWDEIDLSAAVWTIPASRMKGNRVHRVPLAPRAVAILKQLAEVQLGSCVFPSMTDPNKPASDMGLRTLLGRLRPNGAELATKHGFRSSFRDWAAETTSFPNHVVEMALAHTIGDATEAAYRRGDLFVKRRKLMEAWAAYCAGKSAEIMPLQRRAV
jgi:integrase